MLLKSIRSKKIVWAFPITVFLVNFILVFLNPSESFWIIISPVFHFLGGAAMAMLFLNFWEGRPELYSFKNNFLVVLILAVSFSALAGVLWEHAEFLLDFFFGAKTTLSSFQGSLADTMADLFFDLVGAAVVAGVFIKKSGKAPNS